MSIEIRALSPADAERFVGLFDAMAFEHAREWKTCYCRYYQTGCDFDAWIKRTGAENRVDALNAIRTGTMHGYVAIEDDRCVGWVNAGDALDFVRLHDDLKGYVGSAKIGLTICFVIEPAHRNHGLARQLLHAAIDGFRAQGFDAAIALPVDRPMADERRYRGTMNMYREAGYVEKERHEPVVVMRLDLK